MDPTDNAPAKTNIPSISIIELNGMDYILLDVLSKKYSAKFRFESEKSGTFVLAYLPTSESTAKSSKLLCDNARNFVDGWFEFARMRAVR